MRGARRLSPAWIGSGLALATAVGASAAGCAEVAKEQPPAMAESPDGGQGSQASGVSGVNADSGANAPTGSAISVQPYNWQLIANTSLCDGGGPTVGLSPLRRISRLEYDNIVRDLLNDSSLPAVAFEFPAESPMADGVNFNTNTYTFVTSTLIPQQYLFAAESLAQTAVGQNPLTNLLNQVPANACNQRNDACAQAFIDYFVNRAFRGQYDASVDGQAFFNIYSAAKTQFNSFAIGIQAVITTVLTSARFLFVFEFGVPNQAGSVVPLSQNEIATRLSLFLWRSIPDSTLLQAAANNQLSTPDQLQAQAVRMLADPRAQDALHDFATQWMELENTPTVTKDTQFTKWNAQVASDLQQETLVTFADDVLGGDAGTGRTLTDLMTSGESCINQDLASFYGVSSGGSACVDSSGGGFARVSVNPPGLSVRAGVLTNGSVMATQAHTTLTSPTLRGLLVREQVLCDPVQPPPAGGVPLPDGGVLMIGAAPASLPADESTRQVDELTHMNENTVCLGCHQLMDPIGFGFGHLDATGAYQAVDSNGLDGGAPIDASASVYAENGEMPIAFNGSVDLATSLAADPQVAECFALQQFRYALSRVEGLADSCSAQQVYSSFEGSGENLQSLIVAMVGSDAFRYRNVETPESACQ